MCRTGSVKPWSRSAVFFTRSRLHPRSNANSTCDGRSVVLGNPGHNAAPGLRRIAKRVCSRRRLGMIGTTCRCATGAQASSATWMAVSGWREVFSKPYRQDIGQPYLSYNQKNIPKEGWSKLLLTFAAPSLYSCSVFRGQESSGRRQPHDQSRTPNSSIEACITNERGRSPALPAQRPWGMR